MHRLFIIKTSNTFSYSKRVKLNPFSKNLVAQELQDINNDEPEYGKLISRASLVKNWK